MSPIQKSIFLKICFDYNLKTKLLNMILNFLEWTHELFADIMYFTTVRLRIKRNAVTYLNIIFYKDFSLLTI